MEKANTKCHKCKYAWKSTSKLFKVTCPSCGAKVDKGNLKDANKKLGRNGNEQ